MFQSVWTAVPCMVILSMLFRFCSYIFFFLVVARFVVCCSLQLNKQLRDFISQFSVCSWQSVTRYAYRSFNALWSKNQSGGRRNCVHFNFFFCCAQMPIMRYYEILLRIDKQHCVCTLTFCEKYFPFYFCVFFYFFLLFCLNHRLIDGKVEKELLFKYGKIAISIFLLCIELPRKSINQIDF